jgi:cell division protein ZapA (FtsZ GTPase activity inhibitor)
VLFDLLVILGLNLWDNHLKAKKKLQAHEEAMDHEIIKKDSRANKTETRNQRRADDKKQKHEAKGQVSFTPKQHINQPKKGL